MSERKTKFEEFYHEYAGKHEDPRIDPLIDLIEKAFYAGAQAGVGCIANRISLLEGAQDPSEVIQGVSDVITGAAAEVQLINERFA